VPKFQDDNGRDVIAVTAEQHAIDNPSHVLTVTYDFPRGDEGQALDDEQMLQIHCVSCEWWDQQGVRA
jgi:hypothetical protein